MILMSMQNVKKSCHYLQIHIVKYNIGIKDILLILKITGNLSGITRGHILFQNYLAI